MQANVKIKQVNIQANPQLRQIRLLGYKEAQTPESIKSATPDWVLTLNLDQAEKILTELDDAVQLLKELP